MPDSSRGLDFLRFRVFRSSRASPHCEGAPSFLEAGIGCPIQSLGPCLHWPLPGEARWLPWSNLEEGEKAPLNPGARRNLLLLARRPRRQRRVQSSLRGRLSELVQPQFFARVGVGIEGRWSLRANDRRFHFAWPAPPCQRRRTPRDGGSNPGGYRPSRRSCPAQGWVSRKPARRQTTPRGMAKVGCLCSS